MNKKPKYHLEWWEGAREVYALRDTEVIACIDLFTPNVCPTRCTKYLEDGQFIMSSIQALSEQQGSDLYKRINKLLETSQRPFSELLEALGYNSLRQLEHPKNKQGKRPDVIIKDEYYDAD